MPCIEDISISDPNDSEQRVNCSMKTPFYDRIMPEDECKAIRRKHGQSIVLENVTFNRKTEHNFIASPYSNACRAGRDSYGRYPNV